eukprot:361209-Chlamydomonas_euryale.AAC.2
MANGHPRGVQRRPRTHNPQPFNPADMAHVETSVCLCKQRREERKERGKQPPNPEGTASWQEN